MSAKVRVTNLAGHKFPSGVGFRRAFLEFAVKSEDKTVWASGMTNRWGVIGKVVDGKFHPLPTELFKGGLYQPHYNTIRTEDQVQIYEELTKDSNGNITTSFLGLKKEVKDNRLLPKGWSRNGPNAKITQPIGVKPDDDAEYFNGSGTDVLEYEIALPKGLRGPLTVSATLYYQSLPPYYLRDRFRTAHLPASKNLFYFVSTLKLAGDLSDWKLKITKDEKALP
jgi:hypothetical protein